jgi:hypothetical protein
MVGRPLKCGRYLAGLLLTCSLVFLLTRVSHADAIIDEHWQGSWWNNWSYSGVWADSLGLHGAGTAFYSGSLPSDHSIELRMSCSPTYSSAFYAYVRHSDSWYEADVGTSNWLGLYAYDASANEGAGGYYTMGTAYVSYLSCSQPLRLTAHGSDISVVSGGQRLIGGDDYLTSSGTAGVYVWTTGASTALAEAIIRGADSAPPTPPSLVAHGAWYRIDLSWSPSVDADSGVWYYAVYRNGTHWASVYPPSTSVSDAYVQNGSTYSYAVRATDNEWNTSALSNTAIVTLISVAVYPQYLTMGALQTQPFTAMVTGNPNTDVTWSMSPSVGSLSANGLYTAPSLIGSTQTVAIRATSVADPNNWNTATVTLMPVSVIVTPSSASLAALQTRQFTAIVQNTSNTAVTWTRSPSVGTLSSSGLYTAPALIASSQTVTVTATSNADPSKSASATITLLPISVTVSPSSITLAANQSQQFTAYVANTTNTAVIWTMSPSLGTLSPSGLYTAPASFTPPQTVAIMATSVADPTKANVATVTLQPPQPILDERWQSNWQSRWNSSGVWADPLGLHGNGTAFYAANLPADYSVELRTNCTSASSSYFYAYARYNDSYGYRAWYEADVYNSNWIGAYAYDSTANEGEGAWFTLGTASLAYPACSRAARLTVHGSSIIVASGGQRVIAADDSAITGGTAGVEVHVPANEPQTALTELIIWPADNTAPPVPVNLTAQAVSGHIELNWSPSVDAESGIWYYTVRRNGAVYGSATAPSTTFWDTSVQPSGAYSYTVSATDNEYNSSPESNSVLITLVTVAVSPSYVSRFANQTQQFTANVTGSANTAVSWSMQPSLGALSADGLYTAPAVIASQQTVTVRATSVANPASSGTATVTLYPVAVAVSPTTASLGASQTRQFTATVQNTANTAVTWSVISGSGTVDSSGLYTAPGSIPSSQTATVRATSVADPAKFANATVTLLPISVGVSPVTITLAANQTRQFVASVYNTTNTGVTWTMSPQIGTLTVAGLYTAPASFTSGQTVIITATSTADSSKSATATLTLLTRQPIGSLSLSGNGSSFYSGNLPSDDYSVEVQTSCGSSSSFHAYARYSSSAWYKADAGSYNWVGLYAWDGSANEGAGDYYTLGEASPGYLSCSRPLTLAVHGGTVIVISGGQRLIAADDYTASSGTAGLEVNSSPPTSSTATIWPADTTPPPPPVNLAAQVVSGNIVLSWSPSVDAESGIWYYTVYRNGAFHGAVDATATTLTDYRVRPGPTYTYSLVAIDNESNASEMSAGVSFTIPGTAPVPSLTQLSPSSTEAGSLPPGWTFWLSVYGTDFMPDSYIQWNGGPLVTTWVSRTFLAAKIDRANLASPRTALVTVVTPAPGGGTSNSLTFTVTASGTVPPVVTGLSPASVTAGSSGFTLTVGGANFMVNSSVQWNGSARPTNYVNSTQLTADITAADVASADVVQVTVLNPGGGTSNGLQFTITVNGTPAPVVTGISPASVPAGSGVFTLTVNGTNFLTTSIVRWNGSDRTTTYISSSRLTASITANDVLSAGTAQVAAFTPPPGGGISSPAATFTISNPGDNPVPAIDTLSPGSVVPGSPAFTLTVTGNNYVSASVVRWNGSDRATTYVSPTQLTAAIPAADVASAGTVPVAVSNPAPGGGTSSASPVLVWGCWGSDTTLWLGTTAVRLNGNEVRHITSQHISGTFSNLWQNQLKVQYYINGALIAGTPGSGWWSNKGLGEALEWMATSTLQYYGPGRYTQNASHDAYTPYCGGWWYSDVARQFGLSRGWPPPWGSWAWIDISRPARPDYAAGAATALWYLGPGIAWDGNYTAQTVFTPGAANGAPETPVYVITAGGDKLSLSCTNCTSPTATATAASSGCHTFDVVVQTSYNGFMSDPFYLFINRPWNLVAANDQVGNTWVYSAAKDNGYETFVNYQTYGLCATDPPMSGYHVNEQLGSPVPYYPGDNWAWGPATAWFMPSGLNPPTWFDRISVFSPGSNPGDPAYCGTGLLCVPQWSNPGVGPHTLVDHIPQTWFIGSSSSGSGARVQTNTLQRYTDSGWHTDIVTPKP